jgi:hypothetical protein
MRMLVSQAQREARVARDTAPLMPMQYSPLTSRPEARAKDLCQLGFGDQAVGTCCIQETLPISGQAPAWSSVCRLGQSISSLHGGGH